MFSRSVARSASQQIRNASTKAPSTTTTVGVWERSKLYGRAPTNLVDPMHGSGRLGEATKNEYANMSIFIAALGGTLVAGVFLMEAQRKPAEA